MKKLLFLIGLIFTTNCYAATITLNTISNDSTASTFNANFTTLSNLANGTVEGSCDGGTTVCNVKADTIFEINMADDANPRTRDAELFGIGADSVSGGTLTQTTVVESGCVPADDTDLTSDISACIAYVNGYRVSKSATANTYTASRDCYVDLSQSGVYTTTCVTNGATQPAVAANSTRLAKVVTDGTEITTITSLYTTRVPGLIIPANYRDGLIVSKDSTTTLVVLPGSAEVNNTMVSKTGSTTLTISTAGDYAGGSSLRAASTYGFVGIDDDGNIKLHTTAPTHSDYAVSNTAGKKRYATWSSVVYRILGWFYMDGAQLVENASNIQEHGIANSIQTNDTAIVSLTSSLTKVAETNFYNSGGIIRLSGAVSMDAGTTDILMFDFRRGSTNLDGSGNVSASANAGQPAGVSASYLEINRPQGTSAYSIMARSASTLNMRKRGLIVSEE